MSLCSDNRLDGTSPCGWRHDGGGCRVSSGGMVMFEQEIEMEKRESSVVPLLLIVALILAIVGVAGYYLIENRKVLSMQEATQIASSVLHDQAPPAIRFHGGLIKSSVNDNPQGVHYKLLE